MSARRERWGPACVMRGTLPLLLALSVASCAAPDPGRDVIPLSVPGRTSASAVDTTTIPLEEVRKSQAASVSQRVANTDIAITYSRPVARGREIFGGIVPLGEVWNPGADQASAITFSRPVRVQGAPLPAGTYSIWGIPGLAEWTLIFSRAGEVYHTPYPGESEDALRLVVPVETAPHTEVLTFDFPFVEGKAAVLQLRWASTALSLRLEVP
jgi:hypothetical protein